MHIAVCDDNIADRKQMERLLQRSSDKRIKTTGVFYIDSYGNVEAVLRSPMLYDIFFIDMTNGDVNGFQLARRLISAGVTVPIVLCCSSIDYRQIVTSAIQDSDPFKENNEILLRQLESQIRYLDKPIRNVELEEQLDHAIEIKEKIIPTIELRGEKETMYVHEDEILYARKNGNFVRITLTGCREIDILSTVVNFYQQLMEFDHFIAISERTIINAAHIHKLSLTRITMKDDQCFHLSPLLYFTVKATRECSTPTE